MNHPPSALLSCPEDLILDHILTRLSLLSLVSCSASCRQLNRMIKSSVILTYLQELEIAGFVDDTSISYDRIPIPERLRLLREREKRHSDPGLNYLWQQSFRIPSINPQHFNQYHPECSSSGFLYLKRAENMISLAELRGYSLPCEESGQIAESKDIMANQSLCGDDEVVTWAMAIEKSDLVACLARHPLPDLKISEFVLRVYLIQHSTCRFHTLAFHPVLDIANCPMGRGQVCSMFITISEDIIVVQYTERWGPSVTLSVWNWKTGQKIGQLETTSDGFACSHALLGPTMLLLPRGNSYGPDGFDVFRIPSSDSIDAESDLTLCKISSFLLPPFLTEATRRQLFSTPNPTAGDYSSSTFSANHEKQPFFRDPRSDLIVLSFPTESVAYELVVFSGTIQEMLLTSERIAVTNSSSEPTNVVDPVRKVSWEEWGPRYARVLLRPSMFRSTRPKVCGSRLVRLADNGKAFEVLDFGRFFGRRYRDLIGNPTVTITDVDPGLSMDAHSHRLPRKSSLDSSGSVSTTAVWRQTSTSKVIDEPYDSTRSTLPYVSRLVKFPAHAPRWTKIMVDEKRICGFEHSWRLSERPKLDVMYFG